MQRFITAFILLFTCGTVLAGPSQYTSLFLMKAVIASAPEPKDGGSGGLLEDVKFIRIINLGPVINHSGLDYGPTVSADGKTLYYVSNRPGSRITRDGDLSHDFWATKKNHYLDTVFNPPYNIDTLDAGVNTTLNEGLASIAADRQTLYFTGCNRADGLGDCDIYMSEIQGDKWSKPINLGRNVNSEFWDSQPSITADKSRLYFASNRPSPTNPDGEGQKDTDIWYCDWDEDLGEWKPAKNMGPDINTTRAETAPFIAADGITLFFSSDGHLPNMGGLDFYKVSKTGQKDREGRDKWSKPVPLPAPINTPEDDQFITLPASADVMYFSSRRRDIPGAQGDLDVFMAFVPQFFRAVNVIVDVVDECSGQNVPATVTFKNPYTARSSKKDVTTSDIEANIIVGNEDYGPASNRRTSVPLQVTAFSTTYGEQSITIDVEDPGATKDRTVADEKLEIRRRITLGRRPTLTSEMEFSTWAIAEKQSFKGLVLEERITYKLYPQLPYVFFDLNSSTIPKRYTLFSSSAQTRDFNDEKVPGETLDKYYHVLNVFGYRLRKHPSVKVKIVGCLDENNEDKNSTLSKDRAQALFTYLKNVWNIDEARMTMEFMGWPKTRSNPKDSLGVVENRRTEMYFEGDAEEVWQVERPILDKDPTLFPSPLSMNFVMSNGIAEEITQSRRIEVMRGGKMWKNLTNVGTSQPAYAWDWFNDDGDYPKTEGLYEAQLVVVSKNGQECRSDVHKIPVKRLSREQRTVVQEDEKTIEQYDLILFPFDRFDPGPKNERILREYVFPRVRQTSELKVEGHTDVVGLDTHNKRLSENRARTTRELIEKAARGSYKSLASVGVGEEEPLYRNELPEERFFNRTVRVYIQTPVKDAE